MAQIEILSEEEISGGWAFGAQMLDANGELFKVTMTLNWSDYNLWSPDGGDEPSGVAEAVLMYLLSKQAAADLRPRFRIVALVDQKSRAMSRSGVWIPRVCKSRRVGGRMIHRTGGRSWSTQPIGRLGLLVCRFSSSVLRGDEMNELGR